MTKASKQIVKRSWLLFWIPAIVLLFISSALAAYAFAIRASAKSILEDVYKLQVGASSNAELAALAKRHKHALKEDHCDDRKCIVSFDVFNTWLYRLKLEPLARFRVDLEANNGTLNSINVLLSRDTGVFPTFPSAGITEEYQRLPERMVKFSTPPYWFPTPVGKPYLRVALTSQATVAQREHAYAYSLDCLSKLGGGCDLPCDYLPLAWHDWQAELEKAGFGVGGFGPYYPNRDRCK
jgi:hypothetical protein